MSQDGLKGERQDQILFPEDGEYITKIHHVYELKDYHLPLKERRILATFELKIRIFNPQRIKFSAADLRYSLL